MPQINGNGKINVSNEIVVRMGGKPGDEIVFIEELEPIEGDSIIKTLRTHKLVIMLKSVWDEEMKNAGENNGDKTIDVEGLEKISADPIKDEETMEEYYRENSGKYLNQD